MKNIFVVSFLFNMVLALTGCITEVPIDPEKAEIPVLNCILTDAPTQELSLSRSIKTGDWFMFEEIADAVITLYAEDGPVGNFKRQSYMYWTLDYQAQEGMSYRLEAVLGDGTVLRASTRMPEKCPVSKYPRQDKKYFSKHFEQYGAAFPVWIFVLNSDAFFKPPVADPASQKVVLREFLGTDHPFRDNFNSQGPLIRYVENATVEGYNYYIRIPAFTMPDKRVDFCIQSRFGDFNFVCFRTASLEYDKYLKSSFKKMIIYDSEEDPALWFDETAIYSNIENGTGIFAGYIETWFAYADKYEEK